MKQEYLNKIKIREYKDINKKCNMNIFTYIPEGNITDMKIIFIISGCLRDALNYLKSWIEYANENKYILIAPEFDKNSYSIADHEYGNVIDIKYDYSSEDIYTPYMEYDTNIKNEEEWIFNTIDNIYLEFIKDYKLTNKGYIIYGHSSGCQLTHRFMMLGNSKYCNMYLCANAGLWTFYDENKNYPYGIKNLKKYQDRLNKSLAKKVYIFAGEQDIKTHFLNNLPMDKEEGLTRYERATNYYNSAKQYAKKYDLNFNFKFVSMPNVNHDSNKVIPFTIDIINKN